MRRGEASDLCLSITNTNEQHAVNPPSPLHTVVVADPAARPAADAGHAVGAAVHHGPAAAAVSAVGGHGAVELVPVGRVLVEEGRRDDPEDQVEDGHDGAELLCRLLLGEEHGERDHVEQDAAGVDGDCKEHWKFYRSGWLLFHTINYRYIKV